MTVRNRPDVADVLLAVADSLALEMAPLLPRDRAYPALVALNALRVVERQLRLLPSASAAEQERLQALLETSGPLPDDPDSWNSTLVERIEQGLFDADPEPLAAHLWATTLDQLAIDQPRYGDYLAKDMGETGGD